MNKSLLTPCLIIPLLILSRTASALQIGDQPPSCQTGSFDESVTLNFSAKTNKVLLVDFWATWCGPCKKSMPFFDQLYRELSEKGLEVVAINVDEDNQTARDYLNKNPVSYPISLDPQGNCPKSFDVKAMPSSYLIDKSGKIRLIHLGFRDEDQALLRSQIEALLTEKP